VLKLVLVLLAGVALALLFFGGREEILGVEPGVLAYVTFYGVILLAMSGWLFARMRHDTRRLLREVGVWIGIVVLLLGLYTYRHALQEVGNHMLAELVPGRAVISEGGAVMVVRDGKGSFVANGEANGKPVTFVIDTGASDIVLTAETAEALGFDLNENDFTYVVSTANGRTSVAQVTLNEIGIGGIVEQNMRALVARADSLHENLLGMSFLERLDSYEVRNDRLVLRQR
jgi:aspartyl protease family protein